MPIIALSSHAYCADNREHDDAKIYVELLPGKNLANIDAPDIKIGYYIKDTDGIEAKNESYNATGYIPATPGEHYSLSFRHMIAWYTKDKKFISGHNLGDTQGSVIAPAEAAYIRATVAKSTWGIFQLEKGITPTHYEKFHYTIAPKDNTPITIETKYQNPEPELGPTIDRISLASKYYTVQGEQFSIYRENIFSDFRSVASRAGISINGGTSSGRSTSISQAKIVESNKFTIAAEIANENFDPNEYKKAELVVPSPSSANPVKILNIGDSLTARLSYANLLINSKAATGVTFIGNRYSNLSSVPVKSEGQGGWTMDAYNQVDFNGYLSPFMQPTKPGYLYYGKVEFWKDANSEKPTYNAENFKATKTQFSKNSGILIAPKKGAIMSKDGKYISWNGSSWSAITAEEFGGFSFDFGKYRKAWNTPTPDIVHILLGTNDFYFTTTTEFPQKYSDFKSGYDNLISSIKADSPNAKVIIATPPTSARQGRYGTLESERAENAYRMLAYALIKDYDNRAGDGIYLLDYHAVVDREFGFPSISEKPFQQFTGDKLVQRIGDLTHPSLDGSNQMGAMYMGIVQYLRGLAPSQVKASGSSTHQ